MTARPAGLLAAVVLLGAALAGCASAPAAPTDSGRAALLAAVPPSAAERGVHLTDLTIEHPWTPASPVATMLRGLAGEAEVAVQSSAPPVSLYAGVGSGVDLPVGAERVADEVVAVGPTEVVGEVRERLAGQRPEPPLAWLAEPDVSYGYAGPLPDVHRREDLGLGEGSYALTITGERLTFRILPGIDPRSAAEVVRRRLETETVAGSPGKPWTRLLTDAEVHVEGGAVVLTAEGADLTGQLLWHLVEQDGFTFLSA